MFTECGGVEVARTTERMQELTRRVASAKAWGIEPVSLVTPAEVKELVPFIDETVILGGFYTPSVGVVDSLRAGTIMRERGQASGRLSVFANTEVLGLDVESGRIRRVRTTAGDIETEVVVIACGVWSPKLARMAGASIPLTPAVHQMIDIGPTHWFADAKGDIEFPIVRDMDTNMYERQHGSGLEIGSYAHRAILYDPEELPSVEEASLSPTEFPFTQEDFNLQMEQALELMPSIVGDETVGIKHAINGILSLTPDGMPILGELPEVKGLWSAAAVWIKEGPGVGKSLAEWMVHGESHIDLHSSDAARFWEHQKTSDTREGTDGRRVQQDLRNRPSARAVGVESRRTALAVPPARAGARCRLLRGGRLGAAAVVRVERAAARGVRRPGRAAARPSGTRAGGLRSSTPSTSRCATERGSSTCRRSRSSTCRGQGRSTLCRPCRCVRSTSPSERSSTRRGSPRAVASSPTSRSCGSATSTSASSPVGRTVWPITSGSRDHLPADGSAQLADLTSAWSTIGLWGPRARDILASTTSDDVSNEGFPFATCKTIEIGPVRALASRISYVGDLGWELYVPIEQGARLWDILWEAGRAHAAVPCGIGVYGTTGRLEKCYRAYGAELESEYTVVEADMAWGKVKEQDFVGKEAHVSHRGEAPAAILCTLTVDDHASSSGVARFPMGREPILTRAGAPIVDAKGRRSYVTSAGAAPSVGKHVLMAYLPPEQAEVGTQLAVEYMGEQYPVTVDVAGSTPIFDPENSRIRS